MMVSPDSRALLLLCSHLGLQAEPEIEPLKLREWNAIALKLQSLSLRPANLAGWSASELETQLSLAGTEAARLARLMERSDALMVALERLESLGIRPLTRADEDYPQKYRQRLKDAAPPILFFAGNKDLLGQPGIAVVGSRRLDEAGQASAGFVGNACAISGLVLYSGGAKGVDALSTKAALEARGTAVSILSDSLERAIRLPDQRAAIERGDICLATPYSPDAGFSVGAAMGRNRLIYALANYAIVVASDFEKGGTWAGATEALKFGWLPVFVLQHDHMPEGNARLLERGALSFPHPFREPASQLIPWLESQPSNTSSPPRQLGLF
jgi:predicted Rossmann fold nucleotide-binding protein DprA/Smf involved in DNA uptake